MFLAIFLGVLAGAIGFLPLFIGLRITRKMAYSGQMSPMVVLIVALVASFAIEFLLALLFVSFDKPNGLPFVLAEAIALCVSAIAYGLASVRSRD